MKQFHCWAEKMLLEGKNVRFLTMAQKKLKPELAGGWRAVGIIMKPFELLLHSKKTILIDTHSHSQTQGPP